MTTTTTMTRKGQVTVPKRVREALGLKPGSKVEIALENPGRAFLRPAGRPRESDFEKRLAKVRGSLKLGMSTDDFMILLRGTD